MNKLPDYRSRLFAAIDKYENKKFKYGTNDCVLFGGDVVEALTGTNPVAGMHGKYRSLRGGMRVAKSMGLTSAPEWLAQNCTPVEIPFAAVGDIALIQASSVDEAFKGLAVAVVGSGFLIAVGMNGLVRLPMTAAVSVYRVGEK